MPVVVNVRVLPSGDITDRLVDVTLPLIFCTYSKVRASMRLYARVVGTAAPFRGKSVPSNLTMISLCEDWPFASTASLMFLSWPSGKASHLLVWFFGGAPGNVDFAMLTFQVPTNRSGD